MLENSHKGVTMMEKIQSCNDDGELSERCNNSV
jgi:hypothetical protein